MIYKARKPTTKPGLAYTYTPIRRGASGDFVSVEIYFGIFGSRSEEIESDPQRAQRTFNRSSLQLRLEDSKQPIGIDLVTERRWETHIDSDRNE